MGRGPPIVPGLRPGTTVLVVSHWNTLRALVKHLEAIGDGEIAALEIPHGVPLLYELGPRAGPCGAIAPEHRLDSTEASGPREGTSGPGSVTGVARS